MKKRFTSLLALASTALLLPAVNAGSYSTNFDEASAPSPGYVLYGNAVVEAGGGAGGTACAKLTKALNGQQGSFIINELDPGAAVSEFTANFKMLIGGGSAVPADGCSFNFANDLPNGTFGEAGAGNGLRLGFDIYDNVDGNPNNGSGEAPRFNVWWQGALKGSTPLQSLAFMAGNTFVDVSVTIKPNHRLDVTWGGTPIFTDLDIGYQPVTGGRFGWGGRTGGLNANQFVDDVSITTTVATPLPPVPPATAFFDFNAGLPAGTNNYGNAGVQATGGAGNTGYMRLTEAVNGQAGTWTVEDLNAGGPVESLDISFKLKLSNGTNPPADGFGVHWAPDIANAGFPNAEEAVGHGLSVGFDVYDNGGGEAPAIDVFWLGNKVGGVKVSSAFLNTQGSFLDTRIRLTSTGKVSVTFGGTFIIYDLQVPNWTAFSGARYGFAARTGGLNQLQAIDDVSITSVAFTGPIGFVVQPVAPPALVVGGSASFSVTTNDPISTGYQWQVLPVGATVWQNAPGASATSSYTTPSLAAADNGIQYRCHVTSSKNGSSADSNVMTMLVRDITRPAVAQINDTFDGAASVTNIGTATSAVQTLSGDYSLEAAGGTAGSGSLILTRAENGKFGTLVIGDVNPGFAVQGVTAVVKASISGENPADGWSFSWGNNIAASQAYSAVENGLGDGLRVGFIYYSGSGVGVVVYWNNVFITKVNSNLATLQTAPGAYKEAIIRLTPSGTGTGATLDVAFGGLVLIDGLSLPDATPLTGASFALGARTGGANQLHQFDDFCISTSRLPFAGEPTIDISRNEDDITQTITFTGILSVSTDLATWTDLNVTSPYVVPLGLLPDREYYRAHQ